VAGLAGVAVGAALASGPHYYGPYGYYYGPAYRYGYAPYGVCYATHRVWSPYAGGYVLERTAYAC